MLLLLFSCPGAVGSFRSLGVFLLLEFTCCLPFSRLTELLNKIMSGASSFAATPQTSCAPLQSVYF